MVSKILLLLVCCLTIAQPVPAGAQQVSSQAPPLSPAETIKSMQIQPGYRVLSVLNEPHIHEPSAIAWDGNGRMYVVEMRTYMQDIDGRNQFAPTSRVSRHEDTDGDGIYDKHTVFADKLILPRMVLPLLDRVLIRETNTLDLKSYQDTDGDGVADRVERVHKGGPRGGNLEHQPSGLVWNIDNWLYTAMSPFRYRVVNGSVISDRMPASSGQWGLTHDDVGRLFYSFAGGENPAGDFQRPLVYGQIRLPGEQAPGFREVFPIDNVPDTQGGRGRLRANNTLNRFTASCGQSIFRGDGMPDDFQGDLIICEPVGRLIRRAKVTNDRGKIIVS
ncbi:MAG: protein containing Coagulation factor 5/8 type, partial [Planctomycetaceae bacterium]